MPTTKESHKPIRVAVIGAGLNSQKNHLPILKRLSSEGRCELVILCDVNIEAAKKAAEMFGFMDTTHDAETIFSREDIDAVYVIGTVEMHETFSRKALESGKHVFVEKPATKNLESALSLVVLAKEKKKIFAVGLNRFFYQSIVEIKDAVEGKSKISSFEGVYHKPFLDEKYMYGSSSWFSYSSIHGLSAMLELLGSLGLPQSLYSGTNMVTGETPQNLSLLLRWKSGEHATFSSNNSAGDRMEKYTLHAYGASYSSTERDLTIFYSDGKKEQRSYEDLPLSRGFYGEHAEFCEAIHSGIDPKHSLSNTLPLTYIIELCEQGFCGDIDWSHIAKQSRSDASQKPVSLNIRHEDQKEKPLLLIQNPQTVKNFLPQLLSTHRLIYETDLPHLTKEECEKVEAIILGQTGGSVTEETLGRLPSLKVVGIVGASVKKYNPEAILDRKIPIINTSDIYAEAVAEFCLMQAMAGIKNATRSHDVMRKGGWGIVSKSFREELIQTLRKTFSKKSLRFLHPLVRVVWEGTKKASQGGGGEGSSLGVGKNLRGMKVGLVGFGAISREFIRLLRPFECEIMLFSEHCSSEEAKDLGVKKAPLAEVLHSDIVSIHRGLSERTRKSFGKNEIALLRPGALFINTSRGAIVDEEALLERLRQGDIFACLDVFATEPLPKKSSFRKLPNVFLTSHISGVTKETFSHSPHAVVEKLQAYLRGEKVDYMITSKDFLKNMT